MKTDSDSRIEREKQFHDIRFFKRTDEGRASQKKYYESIKDCHNTYHQHVHDFSVGADVLEYGCAEGRKSLELASIAKSVTGIDISSVAIDRAKQDAKMMGVTNVKFYAMNAESMSFHDHQFDLVFGCGILHHLDLEKALPEIRRVLKPGGRTIFIEPMGLNPIINMYRFITPSARTVDEHPLVRADFRKFSKQFPEYEYRFFGLTALASILFLRLPIFKNTVRILSFIDNILFKLPLIRWIAWFSLMEGRSPQKAK